MITIMRGIDLNLWQMPYSMLRTFFVFCQWPPRSFVAMGIPVIGGALEWSCLNVYWVSLLTFSWMREFGNYKSVLPIPFILTAIPCSDMYRARRYWIENKPCDFLLGLAFPMKRQILCSNYWPKPEDRLGSQALTSVLRQSRLLCKLDEVASFHN